MWRIDRRHSSLLLHLSLSLSLTRNTNSNADMQHAVCTLTLRLPYVKIANEQHMSIVQNAFVLNRTRCGLDMYIATFVYIWRGWLVFLDVILQTPCI